MNPAATPLVYAALFGFPIMILMIGLSLGARRAVTFALISGPLFLPQAMQPITGFIDYSNVTAVSFSIALVIMITDGGRLQRYRFHPVDIFILMIPAVASASSIINGIGVSDALSTIVYQSLFWVVPYMAGRLYYGRDAGRTLCYAIMFGAIVYVPLCLYEVRMSPQLHTEFYGFFPHSFIQTYRFGGFRPNVFMQHGLAVALMMASGTFLAIWFARTRRGVTTIFEISILPFAAALLVTTVLCKSVGAIALLAFFAAMASVLPRKLLVRLLIPIALLPSIYVGARVAGVSVTPVTDTIAMVNEDRANSLRARVGAEEKLRVRAMEKPFFGRGGWGEFKQTDETGDRSVTTDSLWIINFGKYGLLGLIALFGSLTAPVLMALRQVARGHIPAGARETTIGLSVILTMFLFDSTVNAMLNPAFVAAAGGLVTTAMLARNAARAPRPTVR